MQELSPLPPRIQLYDLRSDPGEQKNLASDDVERVRHFHQLLIERLSSSPNTLAIEPATEAVAPDHRERLRSLGYLD